MRDYSEIHDLSEEHFEWLDLAEEFFKYEKGEDFDYGVERDIPKRNGSRYDDIEDEWEQLNEMYEEDPKNVAEPLMPLYREEDGERTMIGFYMERVEGEDMQEMLRGCEDYEVALKMVRSIERTVQELHREGIVHGDLANNIMLNRNGFKLYDPVGSPQSTEDKQKMRELDREDIKNLENEAKKPFGHLEASVR